MRIRLYTSKNAVLLIFMQNCYRSLRNCQDISYWCDLLLIKQICRFIFFRVRITNIINQNSMYRQVQVDPAKTNRSSCKSCKKKIELGQLRARVVDDREFKEYLRRHPDARGSQGYSRGYFQDGARVISIKKYYVHLKCYKPIHPHPKEAQYFKLVKANAAQKQKFKQWVEDKEQDAEQDVEQEVVPKKQSKKQSKPKNKKKDD